MSDDSTTQCLLFPEIFGKPAYPSCPHPGDERRQLRQAEPPQADPILRTMNLIPSGRILNKPILQLLAYFYSAPVAWFYSALDRTTLERVARQRSLPACVVERARIVLLAAEGLENRQIAARIGITPEKAARWRRRFLRGRITALQKDAPRPGRTRTITEQQVNKVVDMTLHEKPANATHWSTRTMAAAASVSEASVRRICRFTG